MSEVLCHHPDADETATVCRHLYEATEPINYFRRLTGVGVEYELVCRECRENPERITAERRTVCRACFEGTEGRGGLQGVLGEPGFLSFPSDLYFVHEEIELEGPPLESLLDLQPINGRPAWQWVALTATGELFRLDLWRRVVDPLMSLPPSALDLNEPVALRLSPDGRFAAVVNLEGIRGLVIDLEARRKTMDLLRVDDDAMHCPFPCAFFDFDGEPCLIHATDSNRLDISDPRDGRLLSERTIAPYEAGKGYPEHHLDYYHGDLVVSPDAEWVADNGWVWHPVGVVRTWSLRRWLSENVWESEDGLSVREVCSRDGYWHGSICWIGNDTLAVWGIGERWSELIPGVRLFDVRSGEEVRSFTGPKGKLYFDDFLFACDAEAGTTVWSVVTGERLLHDPEFRPQSYHHGAKRFLTPLPDGRFRLSRLED